MNSSDLLLLFDENNPFWTEDLIRLAGEDPGHLSGLCRAGLLEERDRVFSLSGAGAAAFERAAAEWHLPLKAGGAEGNKKRQLFSTRLRLLIDSRHVQRWGLKEYLTGAQFPIPEVGNGELFSLSGGKLSWLWPLLPVVERMRSDWSLTGLAARKSPPPPEDLAESWLTKAGGAGYFCADLLHLSRYDFQSYTSFSPLPGDRWGLLNADRFFCMDSPAPEAENPGWFLGVIGRCHLALEVLRRMVLPGYMDLDSHDQAAVNWLVFVFPTEEEVRACLSLLAPFGEDLIAPAMPMDVWALSFEALEGFKEKTETIHDLLPVVGKPIARSP